MSGAPGFQGQPIAFQQNAFQSGVQVIAATYSLGSPIFATPALGTKYVFHANTYSLGSPSFATPALTTFSSINNLHANPYSLSSLSFGAPTLAQIYALAKPPTYSLGSPDFGHVGFAQVYHLFANAAAVGALDFGIANILRNYNLSASTYDLGALIFAPPHPPVMVDRVLNANTYWLGSPTPGYPQLTYTLTSVKVWPLTYLNQLEQGEALLQGWVNMMLKSLPSTMTKEATTALILGNGLRANADTLMRNATLGIPMQDFVNAVWAAGSSYIGIEAARRYLLAQDVSTSTFSQLVMKSALLMTLAVESQVVSDMTFTSKEDVEVMITQMREAFDSVEGLGLEVDAEIYQDLITLSGSMIYHLSSTELELPRFVEWNANIPMPSLYLANRIYADASRYIEIEQENKVVHPAFCPTELRVLSDA
jgi:hypothetical protein